MSVPSSRSAPEKHPRKRAKSGLHRRTIHRLTTTGMLLAVGIILPFVAAHGIGVPGSILLPMHIPVYIAGLLMGPAWGALCGALLPVLNTLLTGMPPPFPMLPLMFCELTVYGFVSGFIYKCTPLGRHKWGVYPAIVGAMICGRTMYGIVFQILLVAVDSLKAATVWAALVTGLPGIVIQLLLVPGVVWAVEAMSGRGRKNAIDSARTVIREGGAACIVIRRNTIVRTEQGNGIGPILRLYDEGALRKSIVVDKVIGKAAAMVLTAGGVKACHGVTVSESAAAWLKAHDVTVTYDECVPYIVNRAGDGMCPMEETVRDLDDAEAAIPALKAKLAALKSGK